MKGMNDIFSDEILTRHYVNSTAANVFRRYGFSEVQTPILEEIDIFIRSAGKGSDIVTKEMYTFNNDDGKIICARPEGTAGVIRALIQNKLISNETESKVFYIGSMFRKERPQRGRFREFCQIGAEFVGSDTSTVDIEFLAMIYDWLSNLPLKSSVKLLINDLGEPEERKKYLQSFKKQFRPVIDEFCDFCKKRFNKNTLRLLDCKNITCKRMTQFAPNILDFLNSKSIKRFNEVQEGLKNLKIPFKVSKTLVRGLDYYTKTVFEFVSESGLGSQNAIAGGGRYDGLSHALGGPDVPAIGMAAGLERILLLLEKEKLNLDSNTPDLAIIYADEPGRKKAFELLFKLRNRGLYIDFEHKIKSVKSQMRRANRLKTKEVLIIGTREIENDEVQIKSMNSGQIRLEKLSSI